MDKIVSSVGRKNNCTFCGVFRRQALDRGAQSLRVDRIVTGHNADDIAETIVMNVLRGDVARLQRCTAITTVRKNFCFVFLTWVYQLVHFSPKGSEDDEDAIPRSKPFKYSYEKEIVMYAYYKKLDYFSTECIYSPNAYRGHARTFIKDLEKVRVKLVIRRISRCLNRLSYQSTYVYETKG